MGVRIIDNGWAATPTCNECGIALCWDLSIVEYEEDKDFWDDWVCEVCNGGKPMSLIQYKRDKKK